MACCQSERLDDSSLENSTDRSDSERERTDSERSWYAHSRRRPPGLREKKNARVWVCIAHTPRVFLNNASKIKDDPRRAKTSAP